jgi:tetraacyldisaccharide 4'-kinase
MKFFRKLLYPVSIVYGLITSIRNYLYDNAVFEVNQFDTPTIVVGNLSVGGTGKTPQIEYLIQILKQHYKVAVLSRGYKRKSKGFILADQNATAELIGDEPFQFKLKFDDIIVAVDADRANAIEQLEHLNHPPDVVLLDDAFQHRSVKAGFNILLTSYNDLYINDQLLPTGNLRELKKGAKRAQIIIVTKCPANITENEQVKITRKLKPSIYQKVFFTTISYGNILKGPVSMPFNELQNKDVILITGIANPKPLVTYLSENAITVKHLKFKDHYNFKPSDIEAIKKIQTNNTILLTTEKDYVRIFEKLENLYYLPIETTFINKKSDFDNSIKKYVEQSSRNG